LIKNLTIVGILFFVFGFITWINAILIPYFKIGCELNNFQSYLVTFAFYISYLVMSVPAGYLLKLIGFKKGMMVGFWIMALGAFIFVGAAWWRTYTGFLFGLFAIGAGLTILQTAANPYITVLGPPERAAQRISVMGVCNKAAGILAPLLFAAVLLRPTDNELFQKLPMMGLEERGLALDALIRRVMLPYACTGVVLVLLGWMVGSSSLPEIDTEKESPAQSLSNGGRRSVFDFPHLILGAVAIFFHVGTQVLAINTIIGYAGSMNIPLSNSKVFPSYTLSATIVGYIAGILTIPRYISQAKAFLICTVLGMILSFGMVTLHGEVALGGNVADISLWLMIVLGFANSLIWAGIWPLALDGLGRFTKAGSSLLVMGLCGNAVLPLLYGWLADKWNLRDAYWILFPCYCYLFFYAVYGHRIRNWKFKKVEDLA
jgi:glucose/galactose transporter